jgi:hypothetical protein
MSPAERLRLVALLGSCLLYLVPLAGPAGYTIVVFDLFRKFSLDLTWAASGLLCLLFLQWLLYFVIRWQLHHHSPVSRFALAGTVPTFLAIALGVFQYLLPPQFLTESETAPEAGLFKQLCVHKGYWIETPRTPPASSPSANGAFLVATAAGRRLAFLRASGCALQPLPESLPPKGQTPAFLTTSGAILFSAAESVSYWAPQLPAPVSIETAGSAAPDSTLLSNDGRFAGWLSPSDPAPTLILKPLPNSAPAATALQLPRGSWRLLELDTAEGLAWLVRGEHQLWAVSLNGQPAGKPIDLPNIGQASSFRRTPSGYVVWDAALDYGRPRILWLHNGAPGRIEIPKGRRITSVSINPGGTRIAVSTSPAHSFGDRRDSIFVVDLKSSREIYRRFYAHGRTSAWFLANNLLATSEYFGNAPRVRLLSIQESPPPSPARPSSPSHPSEPAESPSPSRQPAASAALPIDYRHCHVCLAL